MLKFFSRLEKTRGVVIISFAVLVVTGLVVAGYNRGGGTAIANPSNSKEPLAKVGRDEVTVADYTLLKKKIEGQYSQFGGQISLAQLGMTPARILDQVINARVALQEARRLGRGGARPHPEAVHRPHVGHGLRLPALQGLRRAQLRQRPALRAERARRAGGIEAPRLRDGGRAGLRGRGQG